MRKNIRHLTTARNISLIAEVHEISGKRGIRYGESRETVCPIVKKAWVHGHGGADEDGYCIP